MDSGTRQTGNAADVGFVPIRENSMSRTLGRIQYLKIKFLDEVTCEAQIPQNFKCNCKVYFFFEFMILI